MNYRDIRNWRHQKLAEIIAALTANSLPVDNYHVRRLAWLMNYHLTNHKIRLSPFQAVTLLKLEIAEALVKLKGRGHLYVMFDPSMN